MGTLPGSSRDVQVVRAASASMVTLWVPSLSSTCVTAPSVVTTMGVVGSGGAGIRYQSSSSPVAPQPDPVATRFGGRSRAVSTVPLGSRSGGSTQGSARSTVTRYGAMLPESDVSASS